MSDDNSISITVNCPVCGKVTDCSLVSLAGAITVTECVECGVPMNRPTVEGLQVNRVVYLDQFVISQLANKESRDWIQLRRKLKRLAKAQYWIFPMSSTHFDETTQSTNRVRAKRELRMMKDLSQGRLFRPSWEIFAMQSVLAFQAYLDPSASAGFPREKAYVHPNAFGVFTIPLLSFENAYDELHGKRSPLEPTFPDRTRKLYQEGWGDSFTSREETFNRERAKRSEMILEDLDVLTLADEEQKEVARQPGAEAKALCKYCATAGVDREDLIAFVESDVFARIRPYVIEARMYSFLHEAAFTSLRSSRNPFKWITRHKNDLVDVGFISAYSSFVSDIFVDSFMGGITSKPEVRPLIETPNIWTSKTLGKFIEEVDSALAEQRFDIQRQLVERAYQSDFSQELLTFRRNWRRRKKK